MNLLAVSEAAERLGVSTRQVQYLVAQGELRQIARGVLDKTSVEHLVAARGGSHKRAWAEDTAWAAVALLSGADAGWMGERQLARLKARLRTFAAHELVERTRGRAAIDRYSGHTSSAARLRAELINTSVAAATLGLAEGNSVDGYLAASAVADTVASHGLVRDDAGRITLRATTMDLSIVRDLASRHAVLAALDLASSLDVRERRAGLHALDSALENFGG